MIQSRAFSALRCSPSHAASSGTQLNAHYGWVFPARRGRTFHLAQRSLGPPVRLSLIHISEPTRLALI
eukprot:2831753-Alexandrium_andersonii.AAC.1